MACGSKRYKWQFNMPSATAEKLLFCFINDLFYNVRITSRCYVWG